MEISRAGTLQAAAARDGSAVIEVLHPRHSALRGFSVALARLPAGQRTRRHRHDGTEEAYYILTGDAAMEVGGEAEPLGAGDAVLIPPGAEHRITCVGPEMLEFLCVCVPPYSDRDTHVTEPLLA